MALLSNWGSDIFQERYYDAGDPHILKYFSCFLFYLIRKSSVGLPTITKPSSTAMLHCVFFILAMHMPSSLSRFFYFLLVSAVLEV